MAADTQEHECNFCGDRQLCAVSEAMGRPVFICESCAYWATEQIEEAKTGTASSSKGEKKGQ